MRWQGELLHIHVAQKASAPMAALSEARLIAGLGLEGDRYATRLGTYSNKPHIDRQVTLIEIEVLEALARDRGVESRAPRAQAKPDDSRRAAQLSRGAIFSYRPLRALRRPPERALPLPRTVARQEGV